MVPINLLILTRRCAVSTVLLASQPLREESPGWAQQFPAPTLPRLVGQVGHFGRAEWSRLSVEPWVFSSAFPSCCGLPVLPVDCSETQIRTHAELVVSAEYAPHQSPRNSSVKLMVLY